MLDNAISADQVRARAGIALPEAQAAVYMQSAKLEGWTLAEFQERTSMSSRDARSLAYRFGIEFEDFDPQSPPVELVWRKARKGWELFLCDPREVPRRLHPHGEKHLKAALGQAVEAEDFERAIVMRDALRRAA